MLIPYLKSCPQCAADNPESENLPVIQLDTSTGKYTCIKGHDLPMNVLDNAGQNPDVSEEVQQAAPVNVGPSDFFPSGSAVLEIRRETVDLPPEPVKVGVDFAAVEYERTEVAVVNIETEEVKTITDIEFEMPLAGGDVVIGVRIPEAHIGYIREIAKSQGKTFVQYMNERFQFGLDNQWFG